MLQADAIITLDAGRYRLRAPLASSSYGVIWRASGPRAEVALKLVNCQQMARAEPAQRQRWIASASKEIAFLRALEPWDERHIVRLLDSGAHGALPVMALELLDGDLGRHVATERNAGRPIAFNQVLAWLSQVNQALAKVHQYGWRYLDLKPANLLLDARDGSVKLADFGTSRPLAERVAHAYSGSANWQAPEQFFPNPQGRFDTDARSDYFALGAMFYYLVSGGVQLRFCSDCGAAYRAFEGAGAAQLLAQHGGQVPVTLRADEAALFLHRIARQGSGGPDALALLRALLAPERQQRPCHGLEISRMIGAIRAARSPT
ncbi:MAG: protein kinase [Pseudomonadota bacterium]